MKPSSTAGSGSPGATDASVPSGRMITSVGQERTAYSDQIRISLSTATGCATPYRRIAARMCSLSFSASNLAECTPITTSGSSRWRSSRSCRIGSTCMQLMQQYVQKSSTTTCPRNSLIESGRSVFSHAVAPAKSGAWMRSRKGVRRAQDWGRRKRERALLAGRRRSPARRRATASTRPARPRPRARAARRRAPPRR